MEEFNHNKHACRSVDAELDQFRFDAVTTVAMFDLPSVTGTRNTKTGDSLSCTSPQILNFFVMTKTLGALTRQRAVAQTLAG